MTSKPIRRPGRLRAVWLSYWTRRWLCLAVALLLVVFAAVVPSLWQGTPNVVKSAEPFWPQPSPSGAVLHSNFDRPIKWAKLRSLTVMDLSKCAELWVPGNAPKLEAFAVLGSVTDEQLAKLCEWYELKSLTLYSTQKLTANGWKHLAGEQNLHYLRLNNMGTLREEPSLAWPLNLRTLLCDDAHGVPLQRLEEWRQLPRLKTLGTWLIPRDGERLTEQELDTLRRFPSLQCLYLGEMGKHAPNYVAVQQRLLPRIRVRPSNYDPTPGKRAAVVLTIGIVVTLLLVIQLSAQFITSASLLTPRYARSHIGFVATVSIIVFLGSVAVMVWTGTTLVAALGLSGGSVISFALWGRILRQSSAFAVPGFANIGVVLPCVVFPIIGVQLVSGLFGSELNWFLRGHHPWIAWGMLAGAIWGAIDLVRWHVEMPRLLEEGGCANVPLSMLDTAGWTNWGRSIAARRQAQGKKESFAFRSRDAELERMIESLHQGRGTTSLALWRLGNVQSMTRFLVFMFAAMFLIFSALAAAAVTVFNGSLDLSLPENAFRMVWPAFGQMMFMMLLFPITFAWQRRPMLAIELLRPVDRHEWIRTWFRGIAGEQTPAILFGMVIAAIAASTGELDDVTWPQRAVIGAGILASVVLFVASCLLLLTTTSSLLVVASGVVIWLVAAVALTFPLLATMPGNPFGFATSLPIQLLAVSVLFLLVYAMFRFSLWRWQRWEVGLIE